MRSFYNIYLCLQDKTLILREILSKLLSRVYYTLLVSQETIFETLCRNIQKICHADMSAYLSYHLDMQAYVVCLLHDELPKSNLNSIALIFI